MCVVVFHFVDFLTQLFCLKSIYHQIESNLPLVCSRWSLWKAIKRPKNTLKEISCSNAVIYVLWSDSHLWLPWDLRILGYNMAGPNEVEFKLYQNFYLEFIWIIDSWWLENCPNICAMSVRRSSTTHLPNDRKWYKWSLTRAFIIMLPLQWITRLFPVHAGNITKWVTLSHMQKESWYFVVEYCLPYWRVR